MQVEFKEDMKYSLREKKDTMYYCDVTFLDKIGVDYVFKIDYCTFIFEDGKKYFFFEKPKGLSYYFSTEDTFLTELYYNKKQNNMLGNLFARDKNNNENNIIVFSKTLVKENIGGKRKRTKRRTKRTKRRTRTMVK